jgi:hypothetical protein
MKELLELYNSDKCKKLFEDVKFANRHEILDSPNDLVEATDYVINELAPTTLSEKDKIILWDMVFTGLAS